MSTAKRLQEIREETAARAMRADMTDEMAEAMRGIWAALEEIAAAVDSRGRASSGDGITPRELGRELGQPDRRIRAFLREPDDGGPAFTHTKHKHWSLGPEDADRVRKRFSS
ncbi:hypothetical protein [Agrococcus sp. SGAir0287]|uniref:hypothetical protein n=1 Tax=Agrococcus sp. SGAir0287 TaxID=2070347 RepID=UPI0010CD6952|nr:hypothetical protein [Agrococcus sp. SGAir0287]QCR18817.1 hypothetical protein C1N71_04605 [Agrococcus sp. SGAir0287]